MSDKNNSKITEAVIALEQSMQSLVRASSHGLRTHLLKVDGTDGARRIVWDALPFTAALPPGAAPCADEQSNVSLQLADSRYVRASLYAQPLASTYFTLGGAMTGITIGERSDPVHKGTPQYKSGFMSLLGTDQQPTVLVGRRVDCNDTGLFVDYARSGRGASLTCERGLLLRDEDQRSQGVPQIKDVDDD